MLSTSMFNVFGVGDFRQTALIGELWARSLLLPLVVGVRILDKLLLMRSLFLLFSRHHYYVTLKQAYTLVYILLCTVNRYRSLAKCKIICYRKIQGNRNGDTNCTYLGVLVFSIKYFDLILTLCHFIF